MPQVATPPAPPPPPKIDEISYFALDTQDTTGQTSTFYAAYGQQQFVLYQVDDSGTAQVFFLENAPSANDVAAVVSQKLIQVQHVRPIPYEDVPPVNDATLLTSHKWSDADRTVVQVLLGTPLVH